MLYSSLLTTGLVVGNLCYEGYLVAVSCNSLLLNEKRAIFPNREKARANDLVGPEGTGRDLRSAQAMLVWGECGERRRGRHRSRRRQHDARCVKTEIGVGWRRRPTADADVDG